MSHPAKPKDASSKALLGVVLVLLSAVGLATQNIVSKLFFVSSDLFSYAKLGGVGCAAAWQYYDAAVFADGADGVAVGDRCAAFIC